MKRNSTLTSLVAVGVLVVGSIQSASFASAAESPQTEEAPVTLDVAVADPADIVDAEGAKIDVVDEVITSAETTVAAFTSDAEPILVTSLFATDQGEPTSEAIEPGLTEGWVEGATYFTGGDSQTVTETIARADLPQIDPSALQLFMTTATSQTSFSVAWAEGEGDSFDIYRDGQFIARTQDGAFADTGLVPGSHYIYTAEGIEGEAAGVQTTFSATTLETDAARVMRESDDAATALLIPASASWFMYNTFITDNRVPLDVLKSVGGQCEGLPGDSYGGDNRSWAFPPLGQDPWNVASKRTGARVKTDGGPYITEQKQVNPTRLYNSSGGLKEERTASANGIVFSERSTTQNLYQVKISHEVGNPFCGYGAIRYAVYVKIWNTGVMQVDGYRHPVPAHEAYGLFVNSNGSNEWITMYRGTQGDWLCISGTCPVQTIGKTHYPS